MTNMKAVKNIALIGSLIAFGACSKDQLSLTGTGHPMCMAQPNTKTRDENIPVSGIFVFGSLQHGSIAIDESCPEDAMAFHIAHASNAGSMNKAELLRSFTNAFYFSPKIKSGVFKIDGVIEIDRTQKTVALVEITAFQEVDRIERDRIFSALDREPSQ